MRMKTMILYVMRLRRNYSLLPEIPAPSVLIHWRVMTMFEVSVAVTLFTLHVLIRGLPVAVLVARCAKQTITSRSRVRKVSRSKSLRLTIVVLEAWLDFDSTFHRVPRIHGSWDDTLHVRE
jgi:hypothetical protein